MTDPVDTDALPERIRSKIRTSAAGCWIWLASKRNGYGAIWNGHSVAYAHRLAYESLVGPIAPGMQLDHLCFNRACVRPEHLRQVTNKQNQEHRAGAQSNSSSGVRGVYRDARSGLWYVQVGHHGRRYSGGRFRELADAERSAVALRADLFTHDQRKADAL